jgi:hypothetical protein
MATRVRERTAETKARIQRAHNVPVIPLRPSPDDTDDCATEGSHYLVPSGEAESRAFVCKDTTGKLCGFIHGTEDSALECPVRATRQGAWTTAESPDSIYAWASRAGPFANAVVSAETASEVLTLFHGASDRVAELEKELADARRYLEDEQVERERLETENDAQRMELRTLRHHHGIALEKAEKFDFLNANVREVTTELGWLTLRYAHESFVRTAEGTDLNAAVLRAMPPGGSDQ